MNFTPSVGSVIATFLPLPIAVAQFKNPWLIVIVVGVPGAIRMVIGNGIEPGLMGKGLHLHPITILLALSFWGLLSGIAGMFVAVQTAPFVWVILTKVVTLKPIGNLLAGQLPGYETPSN